MYPVETFNKKELYVWEIRESITVEKRARGQRLEDVHALFASWIVTGDKGIHIPVEAETPRAVDQTAI